MRRQTGAVEGEGHLIGKKQKCSGEEDLEPQVDQLCDLKLVAAPLQCKFLYLYIWDCFIGLS
jgi:hypothetical protein